MKVLQQLMYRLERWSLRRRRTPVGFPPSSRPASSPIPLPNSSPVPARPSTGFLPSPYRSLRRDRNNHYPGLAFALAVVVLTAALGQQFYNQPELQVDSIAPATIIAPDQASVADAETTEELRSQARNGALLMLQIDPTASEQVIRATTNLLNQLNEIRQAAGALPFVPTDHLSTDTQTYLRAAPVAEWLQVEWRLQSLTAPTSPGAPAPNPTAPDATPPVVEEAGQDWDLNRAQQRAIDELLVYGRRSSPSQLDLLKANIATARRTYQQATTTLDQLATELPQFTGDRRLLSLSDRQWSDLEAGTLKTANRMLAQGIAEGLPSEILARAVQLQLVGIVPKSGESLATQVLLSTLKANLVEDPERTRIQADRAAEAVKPVIVTIQAGETIVQAGETITQADFVLLDHFRLSQRRFNWLGLTIFGGLVGAGVALVLLAERYGGPPLRQRDYGLLILLPISAASLNLVGAAAYGLPAVGLLAGSFYGPLVGSTLVLVLALLLPVGSSVSTISFTAGAIGALGCSVLASRMRSREELALLGGVGGLTQGVVFLALTVLFSPVSLAAWTNIVTGALKQGIYGLISGVVALGLSPYLEHLFDVTTPIRLAELANPNRPLLKRLASDAPGTFQHTLFVASLAEAAARALGCNVELVRAGTLYHDIGKMHDPLGFIENQMGGPNKHDSLNDPWLSASIIRKHVTEGLVMARKCRLPKAVRAFIPEHQGTMLISYFHHQAHALAKTDPTLTVDEADFRYAGPIPQSPETGIVMLADSCEAALRSLTDASPEEALTMVNRILRARWKDNQLADSGLSREHMAVIANIFVQVWQQYNHKRIAYPKAIVPPLTPKLAP